MAPDVLPPLPVVNAECTKCHSPHKAKLDNLLLAKSPDLCLTCHKDLKTKMEKEKALLQLGSGPLPDAGRLALDLLVLVLREVLGGAALGLLLGPRWAATGRARTAKSRRI